jgi:hypothetical protein
MKRNLFQKAELPVDQKTFARFNRGHGISY